MLAVLAKVQTAEGTDAAAYMCTKRRNIGLCEKTKGDVYLVLKRNTEGKFNRVVTANK